jgi:ribonucleoside-diphosphate reductase alpha chain
MDGIMDRLKEAGLTQQQGGGIGYDFSTIRPKGADVKGVGAFASGPLPFMDMFDAMCRTVMSAGSRRGAQMATLSCDHPDIEEYIDAKKDPNRLRNFNVSVLVTDAFMKAVKTNDEWDLRFGDKVYKTVMARDLWDKIMEATYACAEPGVLFIDRINEKYNLYYIEEVRTTNPCGERPMGPYSSCVLGSVNLTKFVTNPFTEAVDFDFKEMCKIVKIGTRLLDNVIDVTNYPLEEQREKSKMDRQIGIGITGLGDTLYMLGLKYGDEFSKVFLDQVLEAIAVVSYQTSIELAQEKGPCGYVDLEFDREDFVNGPNFIADIIKKNPESWTWQKIKQDIMQYGIRNASLTSIQPTGTVSLTADNISSGIEPVFAHSYERAVTQNDGSRTFQRVVDNAVLEWEELNSGEYPDHFITAQDLEPQAHIDMQAVAQKWVDSSISKTINLPESISFDDFKDVYMKAWELGCKGCTTYRPNDVTGSILKVEEEKPVDEGGACELKFDENTGQIIRSCE